MVVTPKKQLLRPAVIKPGQHQNLEQRLPLDEEHQFRFELDVDAGKLGGVLVAVLFHAGALLAGGSDIGGGWG